MHEVRVGKHAIQLNNWQACTVLFFSFSGLGFIGSGLMIVVDIIRWSLQ
jgi:hypothetical protein